MQDPNLSVSYFNPKTKKRIDGNFRVQHINENITFSFFSTTEKRKSSQLPDLHYNLCDFSSLELKIGKNGNCSFIFSSSNPDCKCKFEIQDKKNVDKFLAYLSQKVHIERSADIPYLYSLNPVELGVSDFRLLALPDYHDVQLPMKMDLSELNSQFTEDTEVEFDIGNSFEIMKNLLNQEKLINEFNYPSVKNQWMTILPEQFSNYMKLEELIRNIEKDLENKANLFKFKDNEKFFKIAFNVLMTYSIFNWDGGFYFEGQVKLLLPFLYAYVKQYGEDCDEDNCEKEIFEIFSMFYEKGEFGFLKTPSKQLFIKPLLGKVGDTIKNKFHILHELLIQKNVNSLEFLYDDCSLWFLDLFNFEDIQKIWVAILSSKDITTFFESFIITLLISLSEKINDTNPINYHEFVCVYEKIKNSIDANTMLHRTKQIYNLLNKENEK